MPDSYGTLRRGPAPSFAHAIKIDQGGAADCWEIVDLYGIGSSPLLTDEQVKDWPVVYTPMPDEEWEKTNA